MRVLYVAHYVSPNTAAGVTTQEIVKMLLQKGHEVTLIAPNAYTMDSSDDHLSKERLTFRPAFTAIPKEIVQRSKLVAMLMATLGYITVFAALLRTLKKQAKFDAIIVQYHTLHLAPLASLLLSLFMKTPLIVKIHDFLPGSPTKNRIEYIYSTLLSNINRITLKHADCILSLSTEMAETLTTSVRLEASKIVVFPNTVDLSLFSSGQNARQLRSCLKLNRQKVIIFIANTFEDRGLDVLLKVLRLLEGERVVLVVVGPCDKKYVDLARLLKVNHKTIFVGQIAHELIPRYIHMADVCIGPLIARPYTYGVVPRKVIECMACGKPVIVARRVVTRDLVVEGKSAVVVDSNNEAQVASAIVSLIHDDHLSMVFGTQAQKSVAERCETEKLAAKLDAILLDLASRARPQVGCVSSSTTFTKSYRSMFTVLFSPEERSLRLGV